MSGVEITLGFSFHVVALLFVIVYHGAHNKERDTWQAGRGCSAQCRDCMPTINKARPDRSAPLCSSISLQKQIGLIWFVSERSRRLWTTCDRVTLTKQRSECFSPSLYLHKRSSNKEGKKSNLPCGSTAVTVGELNITHNSLGCWAGQRMAGIVTSLWGAITKDFNLWLLCYGC